MKRIVYVIMLCLLPVLTFGQKKNIGVYAVGFYNLENLFDTVRTIMNFCPMVQINGPA